MNPPRRVTGLFVYPFKSAAGTGVSSVEVDEVGLRFDRAWMAVGPGGNLVSQRSHPRIALLKADLNGMSLRLTAPGMEAMELPRTEPDPDGFRALRVWFSDRYAVDCGDEPARWLSDFLESSIRVMRAVRPRGHPMLTDEGRVRGSFADASPALVISTASLDELNRRLEQPLRMDRFRPNVVVEGFGAFEEDAWGSRRIGSVPTRGGRPCPRCAGTLVDQDTGEKGLEPLRTLATFRRNAAGEVEFGVNVFFDEEGTLRVGDAVG